MRIATGLCLSEVCEHLGLGASWEPALEGLLSAPDAGHNWTVGAIEQWRRRLLAVFDDLTVTDLRAIADAARPAHHAPVLPRADPRLEPLALTVAVAMA